MAYAKRLLILKSDKETGALRLTAEDGRLKISTAFNFAVSSELMLANEKGQKKVIKLDKGKNSYEVSSNFVLTEKLYCIIFCGSKVLYRSLVKDGGFEFCRLIEEYFKAVAADGDIEYALPVTPFQEAVSDAEAVPLKNLEQSTYFEQSGNERFGPYGAADGSRVVPDKPAGEDTEIEYGISEEIEQYRDGLFGTAEAVKETDDRVYAVSGGEGKIKSVELGEDGKKAAKPEEFYKNIKAQLDSVFRIYEKESFLTDAIPFSAWARITNSDSNYVIGILRNQTGECKYICYAIDGRYDKKPEGKFKDISEWYPRDMSDPGGRGYWIVYQDAATGEVVLP